MVTGNLRQASLIRISVPKLMYPVVHYSSICLPRVAASTFYSPCDLDISYIYILGHHYINIKNKVRIEYSQRIPVTWGLGVSWSRCLPYYVLTKSI